MANMRGDCVCGLYGGIASNIAPVLAHPYPMIAADLPASQAFAGCFEMRVLLVGAVRQNTAHCISHMLVYAQ
jgi:hypothetical protein